ncbi:MAG: TonB-dependent receptor [Gammaproteobacteria bacterium]|nr:TonB-dependent receptor [Gammaproteobacteria bacterium]
MIGIKIDSPAIASLNSRDTACKQAEVVGGDDMGNRRALLICTCIVGAGLVESATAAEESDEKSTTDSQVDPLSEIVVTATRRPTLLEETPIAITALSGAALDGQHIEDFSNVALSSPSLVFTALSRQEAYPSIRGTTVGNDAPGSDLGVSVFIDEVPTTGVADNDPNLFDLQSIEVLRGPQGTLFGRNVTGGALLVNTQQPEFVPREKAELSYGNYNLVEGRGFVTGPLLGDTVAGKVTFDYRRQGGIINDPFRYDKTDSTSLWGGRAQLVWAPNDSLHVLVGTDYNRDASPYKVQQLMGNFQPALFPPLSYGPNDTNQAIQSTGDTTTSGALLHIDYTMELGTITSVTGYRHAKSVDLFDTSASPLSELVQRYSVGADQLSEELRWASPTNQSLTWVTGLFLLNSSRDGIKQYTLNVQPDTVAGTLVPPYTALNFLSLNAQHVHAHSYATFGDVSYAFNRQWKLSVGARFTREDKAGHSEVNDTSGLSPDLAAVYSHTWSAFNPRLTLQFQPNTKLLTYATVASGFKSGGYDTSATTNQGLATPFRPEKVLSYEVGAKWADFDERLVLNLAAYYAKYRDLQVQEFQNLQYVTGNAGFANIPGVELEATLNPTPWLTFKGNYSYMNAKYTHYVQGDGTDFTGHQIPFDAKFHYVIGAEVHFASAAFAPGEIRMGGDVTYQGKKYFENENNDYAFITDHTKISGLVNVHLSWTSANERWQVALWGNNVNDKRYIINATDLTAFYATIPEFLATDIAGNPINKMYAGNWNTPRMLGVSLTWKH